VEDLTSELQFLVGKPVNGIHFVMDYVEIHFNGSYLRCLTPPTVLEPGKEPRTYPGLGSRDALCALISAEVTAISAQIGGELTVRFASGAVLRALLTHEAGTPEVFHFHNQSTRQTQWW
jgi:hypothetical protein